MAVTVTVPHSTTKLIALADLKAILGIADSANDTLLGNIIQRGSDALARFCNRVFAQRTIVETLPGTGGQLLKLKFSPITTLTSITFDGDTVDSDSYTLIEPDARMVYREAGWFYTGHAYDYAATYTHGYNLPDMTGADTLPHDIQQAALELCKGMWLARLRDPSVTMESVPECTRCNMAPKKAARWGPFRQTCRNSSCPIRNSSFDGGSGPGIDRRGG
jgi:hypothetical protein